MIEAITVTDVVALPRDGVPILVDVASGKPIFHKELVWFLGELLPDIFEPIFPQPKIDQEVGRAPDATPDNLKTLSSTQQNKMPALSKGPAIM